MSTLETSLKPRKAPIQRRSTVTIEALHLAAIQVLTRDGLSRCTTTRIAERAGISVGSLYQYYPNRDALLAAVVKRHLDAIAHALERSAHEHRGRPVAEMASGLTRAFLAAKLSNPQQSKALYAVAGERGGPELVAGSQARMVGAIAAMLATAPDATFDEPAIAAAIVLSSLVGPVRALIEGHVPEGFAAGLEGQLVRLLTAYLESHAR